MDAYVRIEKCVFNWNSRLLQLVGLDIISPNYKPNVITFLACVALFMGFVTEYYSFQNYDITAKALAIMYVPISLQVGSFFRHVEEVYLGFSFRFLVFSCCGSYLF